MEKGYKKVTPKDVFITATKADELKWRVDNGAVMKNRPSGNEFMDKMVHLMSIYMMQKTCFYEKELGLERGGLNQMTVLYSGMSFRDWRNQYVMLAAKELLVVTDAGLNDIGKRLGFSGISTFSRWFSRLENYQPIYWRQSAKHHRQQEDDKAFLEWKRAQEL